MTRIRSYSLSDADPRNRTVDLGTKRYGHTEFIRKLIDLWEVALRKYGGAVPSEDAYSEAFLEATVEEKRRLASLALSEADQAESSLAIVREQETARRAAGLGSYRNAGELVDAVHHLAPPGGHDRKTFFEKLAEEHGFDPRDVFRAAGKRLALERKNQTTLRALPRRRGQ